MKIGNLVTINNVVKIIVDIKNIYGNQKIYMCMDNNKYLLYKDNPNLIYLCGTYYASSFT